MICAQLPTSLGLPSSPHLYLVTRGRYNALLKERAGLWGEANRFQPIERCVEHLIHMMIVHCQGREKRRSTDFNLTTKEVKRGLNLRM